MDNWSYFNLLMKKAWIPLAALPLFACLLQAASPAVNDLPLPEKTMPELDVILRSAVQQSPRMVNRALDLEIAENDRIATRAGLLPSLNANYSYNNATERSEAGKPFYNSIKTPYSISLSQPLFYWGERRNNAKIGAIQHKIAQGSFREAFRLLAQEIRSGYLRLIVQKQTLKRARFFQQFVSNQLIQQEERLSKRVISEADIYGFRMNADQAQISLERAELEFDNAKKSFVRLTGIGRIGDESIPDAVIDAPYAAGPFDQLLAEFLAQKDPVNVNAFNMRQQIDIANLTYANAKTRLRPKVNANFALTQDEQTNISGTGTRYTVSSRYAGIGINWAIFDGFASNAATRSALIRRRQLENDYRLLTDQLAQEAQSAVKQINFSARNMAITNHMLLNNQGYFNTVSADFRRGVKSESDVTQVQLNVYDAEIVASNARADYFLKIGDFLGTLNEDPIVANLAGK